MHDDFIIDENIVINAWRGQNAVKQRAYHEKNFLIFFIPSDKKLWSTENILSKYRKLENAELDDKKYEDVGIKKWFLDRLIDSNRCPVVDGLKIPKYKYVKDDDAEFVYLAIIKEGNLVSVDKRMKDEIHDDGLDSKVKYFDIVDAIPLVTPDPNS